MKSRSMMSQAQQSEPKLFYHGFSLTSRVPQDHPLRKIKQHVDFMFIRSRVEHLYGRNGNVSVDPTVILKFMFLIFYENIKSERAFMAQLPLRLDWLWFCGYDLDDQTPDHSVLSKARKRWGRDVFSTFFAAILQQCIEAGLVDGATVHIDSSMIDGNVSKDTLEPQLRLLGQKLYEDMETQSYSLDGSDGLLEQRVSDTDPDARLGQKNNESTLGYKDHRVVDDQCGIITATLTTPANVHDSRMFQEAVETHQHNTGIDVEIAVADKAYGNMENYRYLKENDIDPCIPHPVCHGKKDIAFAQEAFRYDAQNDCYLCPAQQRLHRYDHGKPFQGNTYRYRAARQVCQQCQFFEKCVSSKTFGRQINRNLDADYIHWADHALSPSARRRLMGRRRIKAEGSFADAANNHGFKRARWRGMIKMNIQNLLIAAIQNLRKLMRHLYRKAQKNAATALKTQFLEPQLTTLSVVCFFLGEVALV